MLYIPDFSYDDYTTYKIKGEDTLESVAYELGINLYELRYYHNRYCPLEDCIGPVFPPHLKFLIIQSDEEKKIKEEYRAPIRFSTKDFKLPFRPEQLNKNYLAMYTIVNGNETHTIKEEINVKWLAIDPNGYSFFDVDRKTLYVDDKEQKSMADELAEKTAQIFYPLEVVANSNGKCVALYNFETIRERWQKIKKEVLKEFKGAAVEERLKAFELKLTDNEVISNSFLNDWLLRAFFNGLNIEYKENLTIENSIKFPVSQKMGELKFLVQQTILPTVDQYNLVNITQKGTLDDSRSKEDFENNLLFSNNDAVENKAEKLEATYEAHYFLDPNTNTVNSLFLECDIKLDIPYKVTIVVSPLKEKGKLVIDSGISLYIPTEIKPKPDREVFWMIVSIIVILTIAIYGFYKFYFQN